MWDVWSSGGIMEILSRHPPHSSCAIKVQELKFEYCPVCKWNRISPSSLPYGNTFIAVGGSEGGDTGYSNAIYRYQRGPTGLSNCTGTCFPFPASTRRRKTGPSCRRSSPPPRRPWWPCPSRRDSSPASLTASCSARICTLFFIFPHMYMFVSIHGSCKL